MQVIHTAQSVPKEPVMIIIQTDLLPFSFPNVIIIQLIRYSQLILGFLLQSQSIAI